MKTIKLSISEVCPFFYFVHLLSPLLAMGLNVAAYGLYTSSAVFNGSSIGMNILINGAIIGLTLALPFVGFAADFMPMARIAKVSIIMFVVSEALALTGFFLTGSLSNTGSIIFFVGYLVSGIASAGILISSLMMICEIRNKSERQLSISVMFMLVMLGESISYFVSMAISDLLPSPGTQTVPAFSLCIVIIVMGGIGIVSILSVVNKLRKSGQSMVSSQPDPPKVDPPILIIMIFAAIAYVIFIFLAYSAYMLYSFIPLVIAVILFIIGMLIRKHRAKKQDRNILVPRRRLNQLPFFSIFPVFASGSLNVFIQELLITPNSKCPILNNVKVQYKIIFGLVFLFYALGALGAGFLNWTNFTYARTSSLLFAFGTIILAMVSWLGETSESMISSTIYSALVLDCVIGLCAGAFISVICARLMPLFRYGESGIASATVLGCMFIGQTVGRIIPLYSELISYEQDSTCYTTYIRNILLFGFCSEAVLSIGLIVIPTAVDDISEDLMAI